MKDRARAFGESGAHALLASSQTAAPKARFHLMGHSFGCIVVSATVAGKAGGPALPRPVDSLFLVQGALSLWSYASDIPYAAGTPGYFNRIVKNGLVRGPIVTTRSTHDTAVGRFYPIGAQIRQQLVLGNDFPAYGGIGSFGIQGASAHPGHADAPGHLRLRLQGRRRSTTSRRARSSATAAAPRARTATSPIPKSRTRSGRRSFRPPCRRAARCRPATRATATRGRPRAAACSAAQPEDSAAAGDARPARRCRRCRARRAGSPSRAASDQPDRSGSGRHPAGRAHARRTAAGAAGRARPVRRRPAPADQRWVNVALEDVSPRHDPRHRHAGTRWPSTSTSPSTPMRSPPLPSPTQSLFPEGVDDTEVTVQLDSTDFKIADPSGRCACRARASRATRRASTSRPCTTASRRSPRRCTRKAISCRASRSPSSSAAAEAVPIDVDGARPAALGGEHPPAARPRPVALARRGLATNAMSGARSPRTRGCRCSRRSWPARSRPCAAS